ncbi:MULTISPECIES: hypothetical protein [Methylobacterium]|uniref:hypothetical protein n=1 Tax=Methylobacterium TaxID=407 RepID=UPI001EE18822|nr:hypothetical protein [Methylobacterium sp. E-046]
MADTEPGAGPDRDDAVRDVLTGPATVGAGASLGGKVTLPPSTRTASYMATASAPGASEPR